MEPDLTLAALLRNGGTAGKEGQPAWKRALVDVLTKSPLAFGLLGRSPVGAMRGNDAVMGYRLNRSAPPSDPGVTGGMELMRQAGNIHADQPTPFPYTDYTVRPHTNMQPRNDNRLGMFVNEQPPAPRTSAQEIDAILRRLNMVETGYGHKPLPSKD